MNIRKNKIHKVAISILMLLALLPMSVKSQTFTYNHDASVMNQFMITEGMGGKFTPDAYYNIMHKAYRNWAMLNGKLSLRAASLYAFISQPSMAEEIDSALTRRAKDELLNIADREVDITWQAERQKIENLMEDNENMLHTIIQNGGTAKVREVFETRYNSIKFAVQEARAAYMPNSKRKDTFLAAYEDLVVLRRDMRKAILYFRSMKTVHASKGNSNIVIDKRNVVQREHMAWQARYSNLFKNINKSKKKI